MTVFKESLQSNSTLSSLLRTIQLGKTFVKWSITILSRISEVNQYLASHQILIYQVYQIRCNNWQDIKYMFNESRQSKLGEKELVMCLYLYGWCLCQNHLCFYIWTSIKLLYMHRRMFWFYESFDIFQIIFCHSFRMLYHVWLCSYQPCNLSLLFLLYHE